MNRRSGARIASPALVDAAAATAVPLPGRAGQWLAETVTLNGMPAHALHRTDDGRMWLRAPRGRHQVLLDGRLPKRATVPVDLPLKPHLVAARSKGWTFDGLRKGRVEGDTIQLTRTARAGEEPGVDVGQ